MNFDTVLFLQLVWSGLTIGALYAVVSFGFCLVYYTTRVLHFTHGAVVILLSYVIYSLANGGGLWWPVATAVAIPVGALIGWAIELAVYRPIRRRGRHGDLPAQALFMASLGIGLTIVNVIPLVYGTSPKFLEGGIVADAILVWNDQIALGYVGLVAIPASILLIGALMAWLRVSTTGRTIRAVIDNPETSRIVGLDVDRTNLLVLVLGSALAAGGAAFLLVSRGADSQANNLMVVIIAVALVGGIGSLEGVLLAAFLVGLASNVALLWLPTSLGDAVIYVLLLLVITFRPQGLLGHTMAKRA
jgi:branched-subunit amino acid ABC-type transport system permease component